MNSPLVSEHAAKTADLLLNRELSDAQRLRLLYTKAVGREPTDKESQLAISFISSATGRAHREAWMAVCQALIGSVDFRYVR